jgi:TIGR03009 family protein
MRRNVRARMVLLGLAVLTGIPAPGQGQGQGTPKTAPAARAGSQPAAGKAAPPPAATRPAGGAPGTAARGKPALDPRKLDELLHAWEVQSQRTTSLRATFTREDLDRAWNAKTYFAGTAVLKSPNLAYLEFQKYSDDLKTKSFSERIVCSGDRVYHFQADTKQVHIYELAQEDRQKALEEGPLPFLFNMKASQAKARYKMALLDETAAEWLILIEPIAEVDRQAFSKAYVRLDRTNFLPTEIVLTDPSNGKDTKTYKFVTRDRQLTVKRNAEVGPEWFDGKTQASKVRAAGWDLVMHGPADPPQGKPAVGTRRAPPAEPVGTGTVRAVPQPAQRPAPSPRR